MSDWSQLPLDLIHQITDLFTLPDLIRFGCVCSPWRAASTPSRHKGRLPFLILPSETNSQETGNSWNDSPKFYSLLDNKLYKINLPQIKHRRICGSSNGWLIIIHKNADIHLFHPFSNEIIDLPSLNDIPGVYGIHFSQLYGLQYIVSDWPETNRGNATFQNAVTVRDSFIVKLIVAPSLLVIGLLGKFKRLLYRQPEMEEWKIVGDDRYTTYHDVACYKGHIYAIDSIENVYVIQELDTSMLSATRIVSQHGLGTYYDRFVHLYLVECSGELLKVVRSVVTSVDGEKTVEFSVFKLCFEKLEWLEVKDLGDYALFLGSNQSSSVCTSDFPGCKKNCIYFTDDWTEMVPGNCDNAVYNLEDKTFEAIYPDANNTQLTLPRPVWYASMGQC